MNRAFPYCRHSTSLQETSTKLQTEELRRYYDYKLKPAGVIWVDPHVDQAVSGKTPFMLREAGKALNHVAERGDHILCAKMDRGFRDAKDFLTMYETWNQRGVTLHMLDIQVDSSTPIGKMVMTIVAAVAEWERKRINERTLAGYALGRKKKLARGLPDFSRPPLGYRVVGVRPNKRWTKCEEERAHMAKFLQWHREGFEVKEIYYLAKKAGMRRRKDRSNMGHFLATSDPGEWTGTLSNPNRKHCVIWRAIVMEQRLQDWEMDGMSEEWITRTLLNEALERRSARIELENEKILVARALSASYNNNCSTNGQHTDLSGDQ